MFLGILNVLNKILHYFIVSLLIVAQIMWESGGLRYTQELFCMNSGCPGYYETANDYPGARYFGRGMSF